MNEIKEHVRSFILSEFLQGESPENLKDDTPLITSGILDSLATLRLVAHLEEQYSIAIAPHETDAEYLGTVDDIVRLVESKKDTASAN